MRDKALQTRFSVVVILLLVTSLLVGCNKPATKAEPTAEPGQGQAAEETPAQTMDTPTPALVVEPATEVPAQGGEGQEMATEVPTEAASEPAATEVPAEATAEPVATEAPTSEPAGEQTYTIVAGDTLFSIAQEYGLTVEELAARNSIVNVNQIEVGQQLVIPVAGGTATAPEGTTTEEQIHVVQAGENLFRISLRYNLSFETVAAYNNIPWPYRIYPGQEIKIPSTP